MTHLFIPVSMSDRIDKVTFVADLGNDLQFIVNKDKKWLVNFDAAKTKPLFFNHIRKLIEPSLFKIFLLYEVEL